MVEKKLKTLKDIEINLKSTPNSSKMIVPVNNGEAKYLISDDIRNIAIEWLKEYERLDELAKKEINASAYWGAILFIKYFFNLDEER